MQESFKIPTASFPTLTGSIVTFNSQYAGLPLKSHVVDVDYTGSAISGVNVGCDNKYAGFINFNQLLAQNKLVPSSSVNGIDITNNGDGSFTLNGTSEALFNLDLTTTITVPRKSHKVIIAFNTLPTGASLFVSGYGAGSGFDKTYWFYKTDGTDWTGGKLALSIALGTVFDNFRLWVTYYDLTEMLGQTKADELYNEGESGITYFKSLFPNDYYDYNAGILTTVSAVNGVSNSFFPITFDTPIYGGQYDCLTGIVTSNKDSGGGDITPTYQQTATANCETSLGENNIWADTGDTTLQYPKFG